MKKIFALFVVLSSIYSCDDIVGLENISDNIVTVLAPSNSSVLKDNSVLFSWEAMEAADNYRIQIATPTFTEATQILEDSLLNNTNFTKVLDANMYEWRIRGENSGYVTAYVTESFNVLETDAIDISNENIVLLAPADNLSFGTTDTILFSWEEALNADTYTIQIATPSFANAIETIESEILTTTNFSVSNLESNSYEWRVRAQNSEFETNYSTQSFTVE